MSALCQCHTTKHSQSASTSTPPQTRLVKVKSKREEGTENKSKNEEFACNVRVGGIDVGKRAADCYSSKSDCLNSFEDSVESTFPFRSLSLALSRFIHPSSQPNQPSIYLNIHLLPFPPLPHPPFSCHAIAVSYSVWAVAILIPGARKSDLIPIRMEGLKMRFRRPVLLRGFYGHSSFHVHCHAMPSISVYRVEAIS